VQEIAVNLLIAELLRGSLEVVCQFADVIDVRLDGLGRTVAELKVFDKTFPEPGHGEKSRQEPGKSGGETAAIILARERPGRKSI
jgi:hypothetical protein